MRIAVVALTCLGLFAASAQAVDNPIEVRKAAFKKFKENFGGMKKMLDGKITFTPEGFAAFAKGLQDASDSQWHAIDQRFPAGSDKGDKTEAKADIWNDWDGFKSAAQKNQDAVAVLVTAAGGADQGALKQAFGGVGQTCKGCHEKFKAD